MSALQDKLAERKEAERSLLIDEATEATEATEELVDKSVKIGGYLILKHTMIVRANGSKMVAENGRYYPVTEEEIALVEHFRKLGYLAEA